MINDKFDTPVLYLVFNRPEHTRRSFEAIRARRPSRLFIAADGPRPHVPTDAERTEEVRRIATAVDWPCEMTTLFRDKNYGAALAVSGAVSWFFSNVEEGVILEDDCVPNADFWAFCQALLFPYKENENIMAICGANFQRGANRGSASHYLSKYPHCWGWASWRRAWEHYDHNLLCDRKKVLNILFKTFWMNPPVLGYWLTAMANLRKGRWDAWDYRWYLSLWATGGRAALPNANLVRNIGFDEDATHTVQENLKANLETHSLGNKMRALNGRRSIAGDLYYEYRHIIWSEAINLSRRLTRK
jgi:hypothetical protein